MRSGMHDLDHSGVLAAIGSSVRARRVAARDELLLVLAWADLHTGDPQDQPDAVPVSRGGDRLIALGGEGAPEASELCWAELAVAREAGVIATRNLAADALDLRHRLPLLFDLVVDLKVETWIARRIAAMTRPLSQDAAALVDVAVAAAWQQQAGRILALAEAKTIEADLDAHRARIEADQQATGVWLSRRRPGDALGGEAGGAEAGCRRIAAKLSPADAVELDAVVDDLADVLGTLDEGRDKTRDQLRADALALLARPNQALALLRGPHEANEQDADGNPRLPRRKATLVVHLSAAVLAGTPGIARCEELGALLLEQVTELLGHREVALQPVVDLNDVHAVNGYEHPARVKQRTLLRTLGDVFPHSPGAARRIDHDHVTPYDPLGPPGQTSDLNDAPLTRLHHRVKTHAAGWQVAQLGLGAYRWTTPHGLCRVVTPHGTRTVDPITADDGRTLGELYFH